MTAYWVLSNIKPDWARSGSYIHAYTAHFCLGGAAFDAKVVQQLMQIHTSQFHSSFRRIKLNKSGINMPILVGYETELSQLINHVPEPLAARNTLWLFVTRQNKGKQKKTESL